MMKYAFVLSLLVAWTASATDLVWKGSASSEANWNTSSSYWYTLGDASSLGKFASGANAFIFEEYMGQKMKSKGITLKGQSGVPDFNIGNIVVSNETTSFTVNLKAEKLYWYGAGGNITGDIVKYGAGTFQLRFLHTSPGRFLCYGGTVEPRSQTNEVGTSVFGCLTNATPKIVQFHPGSTLNVCTAWPFGPLMAADNVDLLFSGATLKATGSGDMDVGFGPVTFENATVEPLEVKAGTVYFTGDVTLKGSKPVTLATKSGTLAFGKSDGEFLKMDVADVTGNAAYDLVISNKVADVVVATPSGDEPLRKHFKKLGAGTLALTRETSTMDGDIEVVAGKLVLDNKDAPSIKAGQNYLASTIGAVDGCERTVKIGEGAELAVVGNATFGLINTPMSWTLDVTKGTLRLGEGSYGFGVLDLTDAKLEYGKGQPFAWFHYGLLTIGKKIGFYGYTPYDLPVRGDENFLTLGFNLGSAIADEPVAPGSIFTNMWTMIEMDVADVTRDAEVDVAIGMPIRDMPNMCYPDYNPADAKYADDPWKNYWFHGGIRKTGKGTLLLSGTCTYTHATEVEAGTLVVDGSIAQSSGLKIAAGAFLSGKGSTPAVTFADGAGLVASVAGDVSGCLSVDALATAGKLNVKVLNLPEVVEEDFNRPIVKIRSKPASVDFSVWQIDYGEGVLPKNVSLKYDGSTGTVSLAYAPSGSLLIVR